MRAPAFDFDAVTGDMPEARVARGLAYAEKGWVGLVECSPAGVLAHVMGEQGVAYVVEVGARDGADARCTCKDFADTGLRCKHVVATIRAVLDAGEGALADAADRLSRLRDLLDMEGREDAADLVERARRDPVLLRPLEGESPD